MAQFLSTPETTRRFTAFTALRAIIGCVLVIAAFAKMQDVRFADGSLGSPPATDMLKSIAQVEFEMFLGAWLLLGVWQTWARRVALVTLAVFGIVSLVNMPARPTCGCFGNHPSWPLSQIKPWHSAAFSGLCVVALITVGPIPNRKESLQ